MNSRMVPLADDAVADVDAPPPDVLDELLHAAASRADTAIADAATARRALRLEGNSSLLIWTIASCECSC